MNTSVLLSTYAMATRFELVLNGDDESRLRAAGEEALNEIERLDRQLSLHRPDSDISWINSRAAIEPVKTDPLLHSIIKEAKDVCAATDGAFDVSVAPLMRAWDMAGGSGKVPNDVELASALDVVGMDHVILDESNYTISFDRHGVQIDLGAIGKGYAIGQAIESLRENGVTSALLHGGSSSICVIGTPPDTDSWRVVIPDPSSNAALRTIGLVNSALGVSAVHGKSFTSDGETYGHVIDPRTGKPVSYTLLAAITGPSPTLCDALSTALLVLGESWLRKLSSKFPGYSGFVLNKEQ